MTINQALDKLLTEYSGKDLKKNFPDVFALQCNLIELKVNWGGNSKLDNPSEVNRIIKNGKK